jgi:hypothetical protein
MISDFSSTVKATLVFTSCVTRWVKITSCSHYSMQGNRSLDHNHIHRPLKVAGEYDYDLTIYLIVTLAPTSAILSAIF